MYSFKSQNRCIFYTIYINDDVSSATVDASASAAYTVVVPNELNRPIPSATAATTATTAEKILLRPFLVFVVVLILITLSLSCSLNPRVIISFP